jgi:hypothetical protein
MITLKNQKPLHAERLLIIMSDRVRRDAYSELGKH